MNHGLCKHHFLVEEIREGKHSDDDIRHIVYPKMRAWLGRIVEGGQAGAEYIEVWRDVCALVSVLPAQLIRELTAQQSILVVLLSSQLEGESLALSLPLWELSCATLRRCLQACGDLMWQDESTEVCVDQCISDLLGVAATCFASPRDPFGPFMRALSPSEAAGATFLCFRLLVDLLATCSVRWSEAQLTTFVGYIKNFVSNGALEDTHFEKGLHSLIVMCAKNVRKKYEVSFLRSVPGGSPVARLGMRGTGAAGLTDKLQSFDGQLMEQLCALTDSRLLATPFFSMVLGLHAGISTCPAPASPPLTRRHRAVATLIQSWTATPLPTRCAERMLECYTPFLCSNEDTLKSSCVGYLSNYIAGLRAQLKNGGRGDELAVLEGQDLAPVTVLVALALRLGSASQAPGWFLSGVTKSVTDVVALNFFDQFLACDLSPLSSLVGCTQCHYIFHKVATCLDTVGSLLEGATFDGPGHAWDQRAAALVVSLRDLLDKLSDCIHICLDRTRELGTSQSCLVSLLRRAESLSTGAPPHSQSIRDSGLKRPISNVCDAPQDPQALVANEYPLYISSRKPQQSRPITCQSTAATDSGGTWLNNLTRIRREAAKTAEAAEFKRRKVEKEFVMDDFRKSRGDSDAPTEIERGGSRSAQRSNAQVGTMGSAAHAKRVSGPPMASVYAKNAGPGRTDSASATSGASGAPMGYGQDVLDICQDGPKDFGSLDVGYIDYQEQNQKKIQMAASAPASSTSVNLSQLLGRARSALSANSSSGGIRRAAAPASYSGTAVTEGVSKAAAERSSMTDFMKKVSIDKFYRHVLSIRLDGFTGGSRKAVEAADGPEHAKIPNRFINDDQYIDRFLPLLLAEVKSSIGGIVEKLVSAERRSGISAFRTADKSKSVSRDELSLFSGKCVLINRWLVSGHYSGSLSERHLRDKIVGGMNAESSQNPDGASLDEAHLVVKGVNFGAPLLTKDDIVIILNDSTANNRVDDRDRPASTGQVESLEGLLTSRLFSLGVVLSTTESGSGSRGDNRSTTYSLLMVAGSEPSDMSEWQCMRLTSITTHLREWASIASVRQQTLMPLTPYILNASPVVSSQTLVASKDYIHRMAVKLNDLVTKSQGRGTSDTAAESLCSMLIKSVNDLLLHRVDVSVLLSSGILDMVRDVLQLKSIPSNIVERLKDVRATWKKQIKLDHKSATLKQLRGGCVVSVPPDEILRAHPSVLPRDLWDKLVDNYNSSQLFAIRYVVEQQRSDIRQDTQISLIQGPPGTGKTKTIMGMVAALLHLQPAPIAGSSVQGVRCEGGPSGDARKKNRLLLCAPSNAAVDELLSRLSQGVLSSRHGTATRKLNIVRLGNVSEMSDDSVLEYTLDNLTEGKLLRSKEWTDYIDVERRVKALIAQIDSGRSTNYEEGVVSIGEGGKKQMKLQLIRLLQEKQKKRTDMEKRRDQIRFGILNDADVVLSTLSGAASRHFLEYIEGDVDGESGGADSSHPMSTAARPSVSREHLFDTVLIDEAAQATEPSTLIPLRYGCTRLVLVGDPRQLPATVLDKKAAIAGLSVSLFERLERSSHEVVMLQIQYRMHPDIRVFPSNQFYGGNLLDSDSVTLLDCTPSLQAPEYSPNLLSSVNAPQYCIEVSKRQGESPKKPKKVALVSAIDPTQYLRTVEFFDIRNSSEAKDSSNSKTIINTMEAHFILALLSHMETTIGDLSIGIITPYDGQKRLLRNILNARPRPGSFPNSSGKNRIEVNTVDGFQGREKDVIIISCVRTSRSGIGFLDDDRRMNVALTRAKKSLIVVGNAQALQCSSSWTSFVNHCSDCGCLSSFRMNKV